MRGASNSSSSSSSSRKVVIVGNCESDNNKQAYKATKRARLEQPINGYHNEDKEENNFACTRKKKKAKPCNKI
ncbi:hypothetical protein C7212DRAFT_304093 [Tuber magnatum]|uniref:Uncharacterized protein n=1 Tax=Tuber magnatum TaxID=42249 RepID=A0A317SY32_9PEZI|nr:hypothetical protein C7212DRAFT_304093 [Tuber magnatum]